MAVELAGGVWWLDLGRVNAYVHAAGDETVLVDAGFPWRADALRAELADAGHDPADVDRVLLTHYDLDHVGGLARLAVDAPVHLGAADAAVLRGERRPPLASRKGLVQRATGPLVGPPPADVRDVGDGEVVAGLRAHHTPGHTPGHVAFVDENRGVAFLGDLVRSTGARLAPSRWLMSADAGAVRRSIRRLVVEGVDFDVAAVGHGRPLREGGSRALARLVA